MRSRALSVLSAVAVLSTAGFVLPSVGAYADTNCKPTIDTDSLVVSPGKVRLPVNGSSYVDFGATFSSPCGPDEGIAFEGGVVYGHPDRDEPFVFDATDLIKPTNENNQFAFEGGDKLSAKTLTNADAGTWMSVFIIGKVNSTSDEDYDVIEGPAISVKREAHLTGSAKSSVKKGKSVTITGKLTRANWNTRKNDAMSGQTVKVEFRRGGGTWATVATAKSTSKGVIKAIVKPSVDGSFRLNYLGSTTTSYDKSNSIPIDVK